MPLFSYMLRVCTRYTKYKKMCDALVSRLLTKPILATRDISHPLHTAAEAVITLQEFRFPQKKAAHSSTTAQTNGRELLPVETPDSPQ